MNEEKLVRKIVRSLPEQFGMETTTLKEVHDLSQKKVDELIGSLMTYELSLGKPEKKNNGMATMVWHSKTLF